MKFKALLYIALKFINFFRAPLLAFETAHPLLAFETDLFNARLQIHFRVQVNNVNRERSGSDLITLES